MAEIAEESLSGWAFINLGRRVPHLCHTVLGASLGVGASKEVQLQLKKGGSRNSCRLNVFDWDQNSECFKVS